MVNTHTPSPQLTGGEILWATLDDEGTSTVFGYPAIHKGAMARQRNSLGRRPRSTKNKLTEG